MRTNLITLFQVQQAVNIGYCTAYGSENLAKVHNYVSFGTLLSVGPHLTATCHAPLPSTGERRPVRLSAPHQHPILASCPPNSLIHTTTTPHINRAMEWLASEDGHKKAVAVDTAQKRLWA
jgi:hypothetical protein